MYSALKAEFRKIFTIRSTYVIFLFCVVLTGVFAFYVDGMRAGATVHSPGKMAGEIVNAINALATLFALFGVLLVTHEYRYNTIMYTLTSSKSRTRVFVAKIIAISVLAILLSLFFSALSPAFAYLGLKLKGLSLVHQVIPYHDLLWRAVYTGWGFSMLALSIALIIRNQIGSVAALFLIPGTIEALLGLILKNNVAYLPFTAILGVLQHTPHTLSYTHEAIIAGVWIVVGWIVAWLLFLRRDAN